MKDFVQESVWQENCLVTNGLLRNHEEGKTSILFIRKCERPEQAYLTMEVRDGEIIQVLGRKNRFLRKQELEFLMKYAAVKVLVFEPFSLLEDWAERFHVVISDDLEAFYKNVDPKRWKGFCESQKELAELCYSRFEETLNETESDGRKEINNMCEVLDRIEARGEQKATFGLFTGL